MEISDSNLQKNGFIILLTRHPQNNYNNLSMNSSIFSITLYLFSWLTGFFLFWKIRNFLTPQTLAVGKQPPCISVIIPARNERERIGPLLESLENQTLLPGEVLVVDDHSTDGTGAFARSGGWPVLESGDLPEGWLGKNWACWQGAQAAKGDILLFLDADTWLDPTGLARLYQVWKSTGGLLTVQPYHQTRKPYEQFSAFFNAVLMAGSNSFTPFADKLKPGGGFGPCVMCSREDYFAIGGHQSVRATILESIPLVRNFRQAGKPVICRAGRGAISFRMYPSGFNQLLEGWRKSFGKGSMMIHPIFTLLIVLWITGFFGAFIQPIKLALTGNYSLAVLFYGLFAFQLGWILRRIGNFQSWTWLLFPLPLTFFALVMLLSLVHHFILKRVSWRGRIIINDRGNHQL